MDLGRTETPLVSIFIPCYNEEATIQRSLEAIAKQSYPVESMEVVIADGMSSDCTLDKIAEFQQSHPGLRVKVVENAKRIIPAGLNLAIEHSSGEILARMDGHSIPARDYIEKCVSWLLAGQAENVGGVIEVKPSRESWIARSIAVAAAHPLGVGDARYRWASKATYTDTVAFGSYRRSLVEKIGKFDESLLVNEDYDFHTRIRDSGGRIWIDPAIRATYLSRPDLRSLAKQYFSYGFWKFKMLKKNPASLRWRQALPPLFVFGILMLLLLSTFWKLARIGLAVIAALYVIILFLGAVVHGFKERDLPMAFGVPLAIMTMHFSWGAGFWWSIFSKGRPER